MIVHVLDEDVRTLLERLGWDYSPCGSRVTCDPPPMDTDRDWLVTWTGAMRGTVSEAVESLGRLGLMLEGGEHYQGQVANDFCSMRRGDLNLIISSSAHFIGRHMEATRMCRELNLMDKRERIILFQRVLYDRAESHPLVQAAVARLDAQPDRPIDF